MVNSKRYLILQDVIICGNSCSGTTDIQDSRILSEIPMDIKIDLNEVTANYKIINHLEKQNIQ